MEMNIYEKAALIMSCVMIVIGVILYFKYLRD